MSPLVRQALELLQCDPRPYKVLAHKAGVGRTYIEKLRLGHSPTLDNIEALLTVVGYELSIVPLSTALVEAQKEGGS